METKNKKNNFGFTLIELLVVIAIIGLLASVVLVALNGARQKSRDAKRIADVKQMASAFELFFNDFNSYPTNSSTNYLVPKYLGQTPTAPLPIDSPSGSSVCSAAYGPGGLAANSYQFVSSNAPSVSTYSLTFCIGGITGAYQGGIHTLSQLGVQ